MLPYSKDIKNLYLIIHTRININFELCYGCSEVTLRYITLFRDHKISRLLTAPCWVTWSTDWSTAISVHAWTGPEGSSRTRLPEFLNNRHMKVVGLTAPRSGRLCPPGNILDTHFCYRLSLPLTHSVAGRIMGMKNSSDTIGNRTCDLTLCSAVPKHTDTDKSYWKKSQTRELLQRIMASNDRKMGNDEVIRIATRSLLSRAKLCTKNGRSYFEQ